MIYYKGKLLDRAYAKQRLSTKPHYFGVACIGKIESDPDSLKGDLFAKIENFQPFERAVLAKEGGGYLEPIPQSKTKNYWFNGVREISPSTFETILNLAKTKPLQIAESRDDLLFEVVTDPAKITTLTAKLAKIMRKAFPHKESRELTYPSGHHTGSVYFERDRGQRVRGWSPINHDPTKHVNHLLFGAPGESDWLEMAVQLNFPKATYKRSYAGAFVRDDTGAIFVAHRGKLTKGKAGLQKSKVLSQFSTCVEAVDGNQTSQVILIAGLDDPHIIDKLFAFAQEAREVATRIADAEAEGNSENEPDDITGIPRGKSAPVNSDPMMALSAYFDEFSGETNVSPRATSGTRVVEHGAIVAALAKALGGGSNLRKSQAIDLAAIREGSVDLFEVKTSANTQSVYTAVGQLLIHGESIKTLMGQKVRRFLVLPGLPRKDFLKPIAKALEATIITYRSEGGDYIFMGL
ncbi:hypothetical protein D3C76_340990 [compost metagenome]